MINELFDGSDVISLPVLEKVRLVFSEDQQVREALEQDTNPLVRKAIKVKISKTVHKYLNPATNHADRLKAAHGVVPLSTTEKLVLLTYLSHDESQELRETAKKTLESLDVPTYRKGFGSDLHPSVMDFLVRETIREESVLKMAVASENILEETALFILDNLKSPEILTTMLENRKLLERSPGVVSKLAEAAGDDEKFRNKIEWLEESLLAGPDRNPRERPPEAGRVKRSHAWGPAGDPGLEPSSWKAPPRRVAFSSEEARSSAPRGDRWKDCLPWKKP